MEVERSKPRWVELDVRGEILKVSAQTLQALGSNYLTDSYEFNEGAVPLDFSVSAVKMLLEALTLARHNMLEEALTLLHTAISSYRKGKEGSDLKALLQFISLCWVEGFGSDCTQKCNLPSSSDVELACGEWELPSHTFMKDIYSSLYESQKECVLIPCSPNDMVDLRKLSAVGGRTRGAHSFLVWSPRHDIDLESDGHIHALNYSSDDSYTNVVRIRPFLPGINFQPRFPSHSGVLIVDIGPRRIIDAYSFMLRLHMQDTPKNNVARGLSRQPLVTRVWGVSDIRAEPILLTQLTKEINPYSNDGVKGYDDALRLDINEESRSWNRIYCFEFIWSGADEELPVLDLSVTCLQMFGKLVELPGEICPDVRKNFDFPMQPLASDLQTPHGA